MSAEDNERSDEEVIWDSRSKKTYEQDPRVAAFYASLLSAPSPEPDRPDSPDVTVVPPPDVRDQRAERRAAARGARRGARRALDAQLQQLEEEDVAVRDCQDVIWCSEDDLIYVQDDDDDVEPLTATPITQPTPASHHERQDGRPILRRTNQVIWDRDKQGEEENARRFRLGVNGQPVYVEERDDRQVQPRAQPGRVRQRFHLSTRKRRGEPE